jgi:Ubiquitin-2 like Rad60 SUMO-like
MSMQTGKKVTVILPNKKKGVIQVDPSTPIQTLKKALLEEQGIRNPENYYLAVATSRENVQIGNIGLSDDDIIYIFDLGTVQTPFHIVQPFA